MVKILKEGMKNRVSCAFCGAVLSYQKDDIKEQECYRNQRDSYILRYITCFQCNQKIIMESK